MIRKSRAGPRRERFSENIGGPPYATGSRFQPITYCAGFRATSLRESNSDDRCCSSAHKDHQPIGKAYRLVYESAGKVLMASHASCLLTWLAQSGEREDVVQIGPMSSKSTVMLSRKNKRKHDIDAARDHLSRV